MYCWHHHFATTQCWCDHICQIIRHSFYDVKYN